MIDRRLTVAAVAGAALLAGTSVRRAHARRLARRMSGLPPFVLIGDGVRLHVDVDSPADAPVTVVFAHGFAARSSMFDPQSPGSRRWYTGGAHRATAAPRPMPRWSASSCAVTANPKKTATELSCVHNSSAITPVSGP